MFTPIETGSDVSTREFRDLGTLLPDRACSCVACLEGYYVHTLPETVDLKWNFGCRVTGCLWNTKDTVTRYGWSKIYAITLHERDHSHYGKRGNWRCIEADCKFRSKRFTDLKRHASSKHCINPRTFECPDLNCKYHQQGFTRKDKLNSHFQKVHGGKLQRGKPNQAIMPKVGDSA